MTGYGSRRPGTLNESARIPSMSDPRRLHRYTYADYVALEATSSSKHEFLDGEIYAMAGGSEEHSALAAEMLRALGNLLGDASYAIHFPSGDNCGAPMRCMAAMSSNFSGCGWLSAAAATSSVRSASRFMKDPSYLPI